jgi:hypothetical protein
VYFLWVLDHVVEFANFIGHHVMSSAANQSVCLHFIVNANFFTIIVKVDDRDPVVHVG